MSAKENAEEVKPEETKPEAKEKKRGFFSRNKDKKGGGGGFRKIFCFRKSPTRGVRNKKVKGKVLIDQTGNNELWQKIVDNSLVGSGMVSKAAICAIETGGIVAYTPKDFTPTVEQVQYLAGAMEEPDTVSVTGIKVADLQFIYRSGMENKALFGEGAVGSDSPDRAGVIVYRGQTKLLIAVYDSGKSQSAKRSVGEMFEYFVNEQNGF